MGPREKLIQEILEMELRMFLAVVPQKPVSCQQDPEGFRVTRGSQFSVWSEQTLVSYREDLKKALIEEKNLMTLKYARMDDLIPKLHDNIMVEDLIDQIVAIQVEWQKEMMAKYPHLMKRGRPLEDEEKGIETTTFANYLRSELETYSAGTLARLYEDLTEGQSRDENLTEKIYSHMVKGLGYASIDEAEEAAKVAGS